MWTTIRRLWRAAYLVFALSVGPLNALIPVFFDSTNHWHRDVNYHPEQPARIDACVEAISQKCSEGLPVSLIDVAAMEGRDESVDIGKGPIEHQPFSDDELDHAKKMLIRAHGNELVERLEQRCRRSRQKRVEEGSDPLGFVGRIDEDTYVTTQTYDVCLRASAAWIRAIDHALDHNGSSLALTRPPGHHATATSSNGFCLFNFAAAAAIHAMDRGFKVSIFDWDVHYGQGVSDIIKNYPLARYVSIHQSPAFPYLGNKAKLQGTHKNILTLPIPIDTSWTCGYRQAFMEKAMPFICFEDTWEPDVILVNAGYDALSSDELASVSLQANDYATMTRELCNCFTRRNLKPRIALGLEGGYQLSPMTGAGGNLADAVVETLQALPVNL